MKKDFSKMSKQERLLYDLKTGLAKTIKKRAKWKNRYYNTKRKLKDCKTEMKQAKAALDALLDAELQRDIDYSLDELIFIMKDW